jgi:hypothetical protein
MRVIVYIKQRQATCALYTVLVTGLIVMFCMSFTDWWRIPIFLVLWYMLKFYVDMAERA